jgi:hypothetical protein
MLKRFIAAALLGGLALPALAQQKPQLNIFWVEDPSCKKWTEARGSELKRALYEVWMLGFVSGHNYANPKQQVPTGALLRGDNFHRFLDEYCKENPKNSFIDAVIDITVSQRTAAAPPPAPAPKGAPAKK